MEKTDCDFCGADDTAPVYLGRDRLHGLPGTFPLVRCRRCGLMYLNPRPDRDEIGRYYPSDYISFARAIEDEPSLLRRIDRAYGLHKRCREVIRRVGGPGRRGGGSGGGRSPTGDKSTGLEAAPAEPGLVRPFRNSYAAGRRIPSPLPGGAAW